MKIDSKYAGKWIASKGNTIVGSAQTLSKLTSNLQKRPDCKALIYTLVPKGLIAGSI